MTGRRTTEPATLFDEARAGNRVALARLLSMVERGGEGSRTVSRLACQDPGDAYTVGITGAPGAGKSTLTDRLITRARERGLEGPGQVGILAIDPSSPFSGGAILGDRIRMQDHALDEGVFIRSMATRGHLGGLAVAVPDAVRVLSSAGLPMVMIETVGVGQQEVEVAAATDTTLVVVNPGWGDAIQANKAGLLEIADLFVVNKADRPGALETRRDLENMLDLTELGAWRPPIIETTASAGTGVDELWEAIVNHRTHQIEAGALEEARRRRRRDELAQLLAAHVERRIDQAMASQPLAGVAEAVAKGTLDPYEAAEQVLDDVVAGWNKPASDAKKQPE
jgi:LAO/AO transport system kinase